DQLPRQKRFDVARRDRWNRLRLDRTDANGRRQAHRLAGKRQSGLAANVVERDHIAGVDPMRVLDLVAVHPPDLRPPPWVLQEFARDAPESVSFLHRIPRWRVV